MVGGDAHVHRPTVAPCWRSPAPDILQHREIGEGDRFVAVLVDDAPFPLLHFWRVEQFFQQLRQLLEDGCSIGQTGVGLCLVELSIGADNSLFVSELTRPDLHEQLHHVDLEEGMVDDGFPLDLGQGCLQQQGFLELMLPHMVDRGLD